MIGSVIYLLMDVKSLKSLYIVDEKNRRVAVQIPIDIFERLEEILENYGLVQLMKENEGGEILGANEASAYYDGLKKHIAIDMKSRCGDNSTQATKLQKNA